MQHQGPRPYRAEVPPEVTTGWVVVVDGLVGATTPGATVVGVVVGVVAGGSARAGVPPGGVGVGGRVGVDLAASPG